MNLWANLSEWQANAVRLTRQALPPGHTNTKFSHTSLDGEQGGERTHNCSSQPPIGRTYAAERLLNAVRLFCCRSLSDASALIKCLSAWCASNPRILLGAQRTTPLWFWIVSLCRTRLAQNSRRIAILIRILIDFCFSRSVLSSLIINSNCLVTSVHDTQFDRTVLNSLCTALSTTRLCSSLHSIARKAAAFSSTRCPPKWSRPTRDFLCTLRDFVYSPDSQRSVPVIGSSDRFLWTVPTIGSSSDIAGRSIVLRPKAKPKWWTPVSSSNWPPPGWDTSASWNSWPLITGRSVSITGKAVLLPFSDTLRKIHFWYTSHFN